MNSESDAKNPIWIFLKLFVQRHHHYRSQSFKPFRTERTMNALNHVRDLGPAKTRHSAGVRGRIKMIQLSNVAQSIYWTLLCLFVLKTSKESSLLFILFPVMMDEASSVPLSDVVIPMPVGISLHLSRRWHTKRPPSKNRCCQNLWIPIVMCIL